MSLTVSITIPCRNEAAYIARCLQSVVNTTYNKSLLSVYVCDGMSNDGTIEIIKSFAGQYHFIHLLENDKRTTPYALNAGLRASAADVRIILGAHSEIAPDYIEQCLYYLSKHSDAGCVGGVINNIFEGQTSEAIGSAMSSVFGVGNSRFRTGGSDGYVDTVAFGAYRASVFHTCGYFDEELIRNQDDEFNYRIQQAGFRIFLAGAIKSNYYVRASFGRLFRQYYQYGYWKVFVNRKHKQVTTVRQLFPPAWVLFLITGPVFCFFIAQLWLVYLSVILIYTLLSIAFSMRANSSPASIPKIVLAFWILHFSYGMGYLEGIWQFFVLNKKPKTAASALTR